MKISIRIITPVLTLQMILFSFLAGCQPSNLSINYFGETPPDKIPKLFAPGIISKDTWLESRGAFSPDGKQFYFTVSNNGFSTSTLLFSEYSNNQWSEPDTVSFSKEFKNFQPFISSDGQKLFFASDRERQTKENEADLYFVEKVADGWSEPQKMNPPINTPFTDMYLSQSQNGNIYFASKRPGVAGYVDIFVAKKDNGKYNVENIGSPIGGKSATDPCIAQDESYIIFNARLEENHGKNDLYISFKTNNGWSEPQNMGNVINTDADEFHAFISPDNKYLFFCRYEGEGGDMYWVDISILDAYKRDL